MGQIKKHIINKIEFIEKQLFTQINLQLINENFDFTRYKSNIEKGKEQLDSLFE